MSLSALLPKVQEGFSSVYPTSELFLTSSEIWYDMHMSVDAWLLLDFPTYWMLNQVATASRTTILFTSSLLAVKSIFKLWRILFYSCNYNCLLGNWPRPSASLPWSIPRPPMHSLNKVSRFLPCVWYVSRLACWHFHKDIPQRYRCGECWFAVVQPLDQKLPTMSQWLIALTVWKEGTRVKLQTPVGRLYTIIAWP